MIPTRYAALIALTALSLAACDTIREKYTGERYGDSVSGPRRAPVLNPGYTAPNAGPPSAKIVPNATPAAKASPTPYDQYDASGNEVGRKNYLKEWMSDKPKDDGMVRKPFKGTGAAAPEPVAIHKMTPPAVNEVSAPQPAPEPAVQEITPPRQAIEPRKVWNAQPPEDDKPKEVKPVPEAKPVASPASDDAGSVPGAKAIPEDMKGTNTGPENDNGVFLPDQPERSDNGLPEGIEFAQLQPAAGGEKYAEPHLSSVPKTPAQFEAMKPERGGVAVQQMQVTRDAAMEQKKMLDEEPTGLAPAVDPAASAEEKPADQTSGAAAR